MIREFERSADLARDKMFENLSLLMRKELGQDEEGCPEFYDEIQEDFRAAVKEGDVALLDLGIANLDKTIPKGCNQKKLV